MATLTIRGIDDKVSDILKKQAKKEGISVNALLLRLIKNALGIEKKRNIIYNDLDHLAGTWTEKESKEFEENLAVFELIDENIWQ
jgi:plasmid stability protein